MTKWVNRSKIKAARRADLYGFLMRHHYHEVEPQGDSLRLRCNHSVSIKEGYSGYTDWSTADTGNSVDCLVNFLEYDFPEAVAALCADAGTAGTGRTGQALHRPAQAGAGPLSLPEKTDGQYCQLFSYLSQQRKIPPAIIRQLINDGILYQENTHANIVFTDPSGTFAELHGTSTSKKFHQVKSSDPSAFWWFKPLGLSTSPHVAYVCEGSIDAISLYLLLASACSNHAENGLYCSIGGVANQQRIDRIKKGMAAIGLQTIISVDNDLAGDGCRKRNPECQSIIPFKKDWNEDWIDFSESNPGYVQWISNMVSTIRNIK